MNGAVYQDLLANYEDESLYEIPHILHQTWDTEDVPVQVCTHVKKNHSNNYYSTKTMYAYQYKIPVRLPIRILFPFLTVAVR